MDIVDYFIEVRDKIEDGDFDLIVYNNKPESIKLSVHIETLNYILYEWNEDHKDERNIFDYILKPNNVNFDFVDMKFEEFFDFITSQKDKENVIIDIETKTVNKKSNSKPVKVVSSSLRPNSNKSEKVVSSSSSPEPIIEKKKEEKVKPITKKENLSKSKKQKEPKPEKVIEKFDFDPKNPNPSLGSHLNDDEWDF